MRGVLMLEVYGADVSPRLRGMLFGPNAYPWVAQITGTDSRYGLARRFLRGQVDYSGSNSVGSRGIVEVFALRPGIYEVNERLSWKRLRRYFLQVTEDGGKAEIGKDEVLACLRNAT